MTSTRLRRKLLRRCWRCAKVTFHTRGDAQRFLRKNDAPWFDPHGMAAYGCPHGPGFHIGHSRTGYPFTHTTKELRAA